MTNTKMKVT